MSTSSLHPLKPRSSSSSTKPHPSSATSFSTSTSAPSTKPLHPNHTATSASSTKPLTPNLHRSSSGKENPLRPPSRPRASSVTRPNPIPRIDKSALSKEARVRHARGRSASPSDFTRVLSDLRRGVSRVTVDRSTMHKKGSLRVRNEGDLGKVGSVDRSTLQKRSGRNQVNLSDKSENGFLRDLHKGVSVDRCNELNLSDKSEKDGGFVGDLGNLVGTEKGRNGRNVDGKSVGSSSMEMDLSDKSEKSDKDGGFVGENKRFSSSSVEVKSSKGVGLGDRGRVLERLKARSSVEKTGSSFPRLREKSWDNGSSDVKLRELRGSVEESEVVELLGSKDLNRNRDVDLKGSRVVGRSSGLKEKVGVEEGKGSNSSVKRYPSKLHEKLAFLEGRVKKIASDIKQTKEMLDLNNPDASKVILSDIQEKISGIEKAMGNVNVKLLKDNENVEVKVIEFAEREERRVGDGKTSIKGLSVHELEARLIPHHKLLKDRTCLKSSSEISQLDESSEGESIHNQKPRDKSRSSIDDNPIAVEFLEALKDGQSLPVEDTNEDNENSIDSITESNSASLVACQNNTDVSLIANEKLEEFDEQENTSRMVIDDENEKSSAYMLKEIGHKISTGGWFVSEGEAVLLSHDDGSCSYYDITNCEGKAEYKPPVGISPNMWRDCWIVRAPSADGCSGKYVVAASAGNSFEAGFCSWDFYTKDVRSFHVDDGTAVVRTALADLPNNPVHRRNALSSTSSPDHQQWFYRPCGPLIVSAASCQRSVKVYDIRDGEHVMRWELQKPVATMEYSSPLQWRNRGKVVVAEADTISLWDVSSLSPQPLLSVSASNRKISALHVNNTDAELGGGVRQRVSSSEVEGNDGVFCTADSINVLDFRQPSGIGLKIPKVGVDVQSAFSCGDSVLLGCTSLKSAGKKQFSSQIQQFSLRKQRLLSTYLLPDSNAHSHHKAITQVWGNSNIVMGVCGLGLCIYDSSKDKGLLPYTMDSVQMNNVKDVIGPDDLYYPSFDYLASRVLLISRDRPALWRYLS